MGELELFYEEKGSGVPIVFLHGYPLNHTIWSQVVPFLTRDTRMILPDLRGHGQTAAPQGVYDMQTMAEDVARLMLKLSLTKAILVGHSMGGYIAFKFMQMFPEKVVGLALIATRAGVDSPDRKAERYQTADQVLRNGIGLVVDSMVAKLTPKQSLQGKLRAIMAATQPQGISGTLRGIADREDATPWLPHIMVPTVVMAGEVDEIIPLEQAQSMAGAIPGCELVVTKGCGHMPMMDSPGLVAGALFRLIKRCK